jgi:DNA-directed RNA polymerase specialized sigma24 family protein
MIMYTLRSKAQGQVQSRYATSSDLCENFVNDLQLLYLLAFLLTGSHHDAEQCFVTTIDDAITANGVFKGWERSWNRRCLIINAIRRVFPESTQSDGKRDGQYEIKSRELSTINAVAKLAPPLQRFVFVMCVLEGYSERECALLLGRPPRDVFEARIEALWQVSGVAPADAKLAG